MLRLMIELKRVMPTILNCSPKRPIMSPACFCMTWARSMPTSATLRSSRFGSRPSSRGTFCQKKLSCAQPAASTCSSRSVPTSERSSPETAAIPGIRAMRAPADSGIVPPNSSAVPLRLIVRSAPCSSMLCSTFCSTLCDKP